MLPPAAESLASPCLPAPFGGGGYGAWAYLFVLLAMLGMHLVDFLLKVGVKVVLCVPAEGCWTFVCACWGWGWGLFVWAF